MVDELQTRERSNKDVEIEGVHYDIIENPVKFYIDNEKMTRRWLLALEPSCPVSLYEEIRTEIVLASVAIAKARIRQNKLTNFDSEEELIQEAYFKVIKDFSKFNQYKAKEGVKKRLSAFNYLTTIIKNHLLTHIAKCRKISYRMRPFETDDSEGNTIDVLSFILVKEYENFEQKMFAEPDASIKMLAILNESEIGRVVISFLELFPSSVKGRASVPGTKINLRTLLKYMATNGFDLKTSKIYLKSIKKKYLFEYRHEEV